VKFEHKWRVFAVIALGILISTIDGSIVNIANPSIAKDLQVGIESVQWVVLSYLLVITSSLIFFGRLGDRQGSSKIFSWGFILFTAGSLGCSLAPSLMILIGARMFQGLGASMMMATGIGIVANAFPTDERGKALGLTGTIVALGNMIGPSLGGLLLAGHKWPIIFLINIPVGLFGFYLSLRYLPRDNPAADSQNYDITGTVLLALSVGALILSLSTGTGINVPFLIASGVALVSFCSWEKKTPSALLDISLFGNHTFVYGNLAAVIVYSTQTAVFFLLPFFLENILNYSPASTGLIMTITPITMAIVAPLAGHLSDRLGSTRIIAVALLFLSSAYLLFSRLSDSASAGFIAMGLILLGSGMGMFGSPNTSSILGSMSSDKAGYGGGFISTNRNLSYSLGTTAAVGLFSWLLQRQAILQPYAAAYVYSINRVYLITAAVTLLTFILWILAHYNMSRRSAR